MERGELTSVILQARLDSKRLPGKALLPLGGKPAVFRAMEALKNIPADLHILACPEDSFAEFEHLAKEAGFLIYSGPKEDVLERFCQVIRRFGISRAIRATGDNPFVFTDAAIAINKEAVSRGADYAGYMEMPYGAGVESVAASALLSAAANGADAFDREHVCPFLYNNPDMYNVFRPLAPAKWHAPDLRLTIDAREDYEFAVKLYGALNKTENRYNGETIINEVKKIKDGDRELGIGD